MNIKIQRDSDPFKKYWWVLLVVFAGIAAGVCMPGGDGEGGGGSGLAASGGEDGLRSAGSSGPSSLDSTLNPSGAPGGVIDLSMASASSKRKDPGSLMSSLYSAPEDAPADASAAGAAAGSVASADAGAGKGRLADALRDISKRPADPSGWGGQKAQRGFSASFAAPKGNFGGLSGLGGGSSASGARFNAAPSFAASGSDASGGGRIGVSSTRGLTDDGSDSKTNVQSFNALRKVAKGMGNAARSGDIAAAMMMGGRSFDGGGAGGMSMGKGAVADTAVAAALNSAPANLKVNDPKLTDFKFEPVPMTNEPQIDEKEQRMRMQQMMMQALLMGIVGMALGPAGGMLMGPMMMMMQAQNQQQQQQSQANAQTTRNNFR